MLAVGDQPESDAGGTEERHHSRRRRRAPGGAAQALLKVLVGLEHLHEHAGGCLIIGLNHREIGAERLTVLWKRDRELLSDPIAPVAENLVGHLQQVPEHPLHPHAMNGGVGTEATLIIQPFLAHGAQIAREVRVACIEPLREGAHQDRH